MITICSIILAFCFFMASVKNPGYIDKEYTFLELL